VGIHLQFVICTCTDVYACVLYDGGEVKWMKVSRIFKSRLRGDTCNKAKAGGGEGGNVLPLPGDMGKDETARRFVADIRERERRVAFVRFFSQMDELLY